MKKSFAGALVALIAVLGLTACSSNNTDTTKNKQSAEEQTENTSGTAEETQGTNLIPSEALKVFTREVGTFLVGLKTGIAVTDINQKVIDTEITSSNLTKIGALPSVTLNGTRATIMAEIDGSHCMVTVDLMAENADLTSATCLAGGSMGKDATSEGMTNSTPSTSTPTPTTPSTGK